MNLGTDGPEAGTLTTRPPHLLLLLTTFVKLESSSSSKSSVATLKFHIKLLRDRLLLGKQTYTLCLQVDNIFIDASTATVLVYFSALNEL